jgi:serine/threonine-protein kinase
MSDSLADRPAVVGRYYLSDLLASSPVDNLYKAFDPLFRRPVVLRVFRLRSSNAVAAHGIKQMFFDDARIAGALLHHGIAATYDAGEIPGGLFVSGEFLEATSLSSMLETGLDRDVLLRVSLLSQLADALEYARESGVPHLHLHPGRVMVRPDYTLKVGGFGLARLVDALSAPATAASMPASQYVAPERARGERGDYRSDVYSLALIALDLLAEPPVPFANAVSRAFRIPPVCAELSALSVNPKRWAAVFERALASDPADRFDTPGELEIEVQLTLRIGVSQARSARDPVTATMPTDDRGYADAILARRTPATRTVGRQRRG